MKLSLFFHLSFLIMMIVFQILNGVGFCQKLTVDGVLSAISAANGTSQLFRYDLDKFDQTATPEERKSLKAFLTSGNIPQKLLPVFRALPIFRTLEGSGFKESHFVMIEAVKLVAPSKQVFMPLVCCDISVIPTKTLKVIKAERTDRLTDGRRVIQNPPSATSCDGGQLADSQHSVCLLSISLRTMYTEHILN